MLPIFKWISSRKSRTPKLVNVLTGIFISIIGNSSIVLASNATFIGDQYDSNFQPGSTLFETEPGFVCDASSSIARLQYTSDGNLEYQISGGATSTWITLWSRKFEPYCPGSAGLDPTLGIVVKDCAGNSIWTAGTVSQTGLEHTNFHLGVDPKNLRLELINLENQTVVWDNISGNISRQISDERMLNDILPAQGWEHVAYWGGYDLDKFQALFSSNPTDSHAEAHRMLASMHSFNVDRELSLDDHNSFWDSLWSGWFRHCDPDLGACDVELRENYVETVDENIRFINQYVKIMTSFTQALADDKDETLPLSIFEQLFSTVDIEEISSVYNALFVRVRETPASRSGSVLNNRFTRMLGKNPNRGDEIAFEFNFNLGQVWNVLAQGESFPDNSNIVAALQKLTLTVSLTMPHFDELTGVATYATKFKIGLFDGVLADGAKLPQQIDHPVATTLAGGLIRGGVFGNHEWKRKVTTKPNSSDVENIKVVYSNSLGVVLEGYATPSKAFDAWRGGGASGTLFGLPDWLDLSDGSIGELDDLSTLTDTSMAGQIASANQGTGDIEMMSLHDINSLIAEYDSMSVGERNFVDVIISEQSSLGSSSSNSALFSVDIPPAALDVENLHVAIGADGEGSLTYSSDGTVTVFEGIREDLIQHALNALNGGRITPIGLVARVLAERANTTLTHTTFFLRQLAYGVASQKHRVLYGQNAQIKGDVGAAIVTSIDWSSLSGLEKTGVLILGFGGNFGGGSLTAWASASIPPGWGGLRTSIAQGGAILGGYVGATTMAGILGSDKAGIKIAKFKGATAKAPRWSIPVDVVTNPSSGLLGSLISSDFSILWVVKNTNTDVKWGSGL